ncbi:GNAT family N-acetyltransferase [Actinomadura kijaniata]|uniref:GNAT family N-acetyltransferase n=1 Tax=Actinomadura kijaniata TaxID=46161 RepID=UPI003F1C86FD
MPARAVPGRTSARQTGRRSAREFVPADFVVPTLVAGPRFQIRPITVHDVVKDYGAVIGSLERLRGRFGPEWGWPDTEFTFEQALIDVAWLQKEGQLRRSFSYVVTSPDGEQQYGRIHVAPSDDPDADACVVFWVRDDQAGTSLERELGDFVEEWVTTAWPFEAVRFPGRDEG